MPPQDYLSFATGLVNRLSGSKYLEVRPASPLSVALLRQTFGGTIPKVIGLINSSQTTDDPATLFQRAEPWFKQVLGRTGAGVLLFVYRQAPASEVDQIVNLGRGRLGYGQVVAGAYDLMSNRYWLPDHMGWDHELFG